MGMGSTPTLDGESPWSLLGLRCPVGRFDPVERCPGQTPSRVQLCRREPTAAEYAAQWDDLADRCLGMLARYNRRRRVGAELAAQPRALEAAEPPACQGSEDQHHWDVRGAILRCVLQLLPSPRHLSLNVCRHNQAKSSRSPRRCIMTLL
jgi:hypothetical protein